MEISYKITTETSSEKETWEREAAPCFGDMNEHIALELEAYCKSLSQVEYDIGYVVIDLNGAFFMEELSQMPNLEVLDWIKEYAEQTLNLSIEITEDYEAVVKLYPGTKKRNVSDLFRVWACRNMFEDWTYMVEDTATTQADVIAAIDKGESYPGGDTIWQGISKLTNITQATGEGIWPVIDDENCGHFACCRETSNMYNRAAGINDDEDDYDY